LWIEAVSGQLLNSGSQRSTAVIGQEMPFWEITSTQPARPVSVTTTVNLDLNARDLVGIVGHAELEEVFALGSRGWEPPLEWQLISSARGALYTANWRRAVIDAGTAAELAVTSRIETLTGGVDSRIQSALLSAYQMLGKRSELVGKLGGKLPDRFKDSLIEPRNSAVHRGVVTPDEAHTAIAAAVTVVRQNGPVHGVELFELPPDVVSR